MTDSTSNVVPLEPRRRTRPNPLLDAALSYAARGWRVFPMWPHENGRCTCNNPGCDKPGKHPMVRWRDHATTDPDVIRRWWQQHPTRRRIRAARLHRGMNPRLRDAKKRKDVAEVERWQKRMDRNPPKP